MATSLMKAREVRAATGWSEWKLRELERLGVITRIHVKFKKLGRKTVPADHGWFRAIDVVKFIGN